MTIRPSNISQAYKAYIPTPKSSETRADGKPSAADRHDRLELSHGAAGLAAQHPAAASVSQEISSGASPERLAQLKGSIAAGTYRVSSEEIAGAMLGTDYRV